MISKMLELSLEDIDFLIDMLTLEEGETFNDKLQAEQNDEMLRRLKQLKGKIT